MPPPWRVTALHLGSHSGTHIDAPSHFLPDGKTIDQYPLERFIINGMILLQAYDDQAFTRTSSRG